MRTPICWPNWRNAGELQRNSSSDPFPRPFLWASWIAEQKARWSEAFVYFKHEERGVGPKFAQQMQVALSPPVKAACPTRR